MAERRPFDTWRAIARDEEARRHNREMEKSSERRADVDLKKAELRNKVQAESNAIRRELGEARQKLNEAREERLRVQRDLELDLAKEKNDLARKKLVEDAKAKLQRLDLDERKYQQRVNEHEDSLYQKELDREQKERELDIREAGVNRPRVGAQNYIDVTDPATSDKRRLYGRDMDAYLKAKQDKAQEAEKETKRRSDLGVFGRIGEFFKGKPVPAATGTTTNTVPSPAGMMPVPPMSTGTNEAAAPNIGASAPTFIVPPKTNSASAVPSPVGRMIVPLLPAPAFEEPGGPYDEPAALPTIATPAPISFEVAPRNPADRIEGKQYKSSTGKIGTWTKDGWKVE